MAEVAKSPTKMVTGEGRLSYAHVHEPHAQEEGKDKKYSTVFLIKKSDKNTIAKIKAAIDAACTLGKSEKWNGKMPPASKLKLPLRDGDEEKPDDPNYAGHYFFSASASNKPGMVDKELNPIMDKAEVYSGCYCRLSVNFYPFNVSGNTGVAVGLNNIQKLRDGEPLGGGSRAEDDFADELAEVEEEDDSSLM